MMNHIPRSVIKLNELYTKNNKQLFLVGGSVRDYVIGVKPKDFDLATNALPDEVIEILKGKGYSFDMVGKAFGVVIVYTPDVKGGMEIATFREDISKGRNPLVRLGATIEEDVLRRDLTINGLFYDLTKGEIVDLVGGLDDIANKITRFIGNPIDRLDEDPLRLLRAVRFNETYGFAYDSHTLESMRSRNNLSYFDIEENGFVRISQERIYEELVKSYTKVKNYDKYLETFTTLDMWGEIFPNVKVNSNISKCDSLEVYLANLLVREKDNKNIGKVMVEEFKFPSHTANIIKYLYSLIDFKYEDVHSLYKRKKALEIDNELIRDWFNVFGFPKNIIDSFLIYKPIHNSDELMAKGFVNKELGLEIMRIETENFKRIVNNEI